MDIYRALLDSAAENGVKLSVVNIKKIDEISRQIRKMTESGILSGKFYERYSGYFTFHYESIMGNAKNILLLASAQNIATLVFNFKDKEYIIPIPNGFNYKNNTDVFQNILIEVFTANGYSYAQAEVPLKMLATQSGLASYGRNNLCYIEEFGSLHRIEGFLTDCELPESGWNEPKRLKICGKCRRCLENCPTGCISENESVIDALKCLCYLNENQGEFPAWLDKNSHNALLGCIRCQEVCPMNKKYMKIDERIETFDHYETELILNEKEFDSLPKKLMSKLQKLKIDEYYQVLSRNLKAFIDI